jgi:hypothetical protein
MARSPANQNYERRYLHLSQTIGGLFVIDGRLDAEGGATLRAALNAFDERWKADDTRSGSQRRADALVELARQRLDAGNLPGGWWSEASPISHCIDVHIDERAGMYRG